MIANSTRARTLVNQKPEVTEEESSVYETILLAAQSQKTEISDCKERTECYTSRASPYLPKEECIESS
ncbi:hypothetical protein TVAGG3_0125540 [Trichomonas vaginalis G3]|uniref:hypothetical protein n=1 Tax=Trichomonas vaginalis (strain ATCC PRA-98 / G3) TaxID=412133 RepID=UPI0021E548F3|nr:hypothetical protein TVAGG3_0125540 [Trichomonas vaginalis G3]KAI5545755.1 hypothetical protein TVAGG3_0125540 [Trichomonas vaginalis G3]